MALESANYVNGLNSANPPAGDPVTQADDHLRLIKAALLATFPNINAAVTASPDQINTGSPTGLIALWYGSTASIPTGWALCNGGTYAKQDGSGNIVAPDLRGLFVAGAGGSLTVGQTGGLSSTTPTTAASSTGVTAATATAGAHTHTGNTGSTALTANQIPSHRHLLANGDTTASVGGTSANFLATGGNYGANDFDYALGNSASDATMYQSSATGGGLGHTHTISSDGDHTHTVSVTDPTHTHSVTVNTVPPYYALAYIMKL